MIKHIVMWKLHETAEGYSRQENVSRMKKWLEELPQKIAEIQKLEVGINFNESEAAFDVVLYSEFESKESLETYQNHPAHIQFKNIIMHLRSDRVVADYEV